MVNWKKTISIILLLSFSLSLTPNFLYNGDGGVSAACPSGCTEKVRNGQTYCLNCPIECQIGGNTFTNKSCLPFDGELEEWECGIEIPIGEVIDRSFYLASRLAAEFETIIGSGVEMVEGTEDILYGNSGKGIPALQNWSCADCWTGCYKYLSLFNWQLIDGPAEKCALGPQPPTHIVCQEEPCESCADYGAREGYNWETTFPDPENPEQTITCRYSRPVVGSCSENCTLFRCQGPYDGLFDRVINHYSYIEGALEDLKNDIDEKYKTDGGIADLPENFKFKRSYILEQLNFSRCELAKCWNPAEDYPGILAGKKVGKHLFTCKTVSDMGLFEDDQLMCLVLQALEEIEEIEEIWEKPKKWWEWPVAVFKIAYRVIKFVFINWRTIWGMIKEALGIAKEEGCYPTNYYCCQF